MGSDRELSVAYGGVDARLQPWTGCPDRAAGRRTVQSTELVLATIRRSEGRHEDDCWADDARIGAAVFASDDTKEGPRAFVERRPPEFAGS